VKNMADDTQKTDKEGSEEGSEEKKEDEESE